MPEFKTVGLIVNPFAGIGGRVALKGSDGADVVKHALELGAPRLSPKRAGQALNAMLPIKEEIKLVTYPGEMGEMEAVEAGFVPTVVGSLSGDITTAQDTKHAARDMLNHKVDFIMLAGGDGTARDVYDAVGMEVPIVGIPAGVKIHSGLYSINPTAAGELACEYVSGRVTALAEMEVMDIDEDAFRTGVVRAKLYGYVKVPDEPRFVQGAKAAGHTVSEQFHTQSLAARIVADMKPDVLYLVGSGTTTRGIMDKLGLPNTLLGIDVVKDKKLVASDCTERQLLEILDGQKAEVIVTPVGGQGYIFGRGNQQLSPEVLKRVGISNIRVIATPNKIHSLPQLQLRVDTGDPELDAALRGPRRVLKSYSETVILYIA